MAAMPITTFPNDYRTVKGLLQVPSLQEPLVIFICFIEPAFLTASATAFADKNHIFPYYNDITPGYTDFFTST